MSNQYDALIKFASKSSKFTISQVINELGCSEQYARQLIRRALDKGEIKQHGKGVYNPTKTKAKEMITLSVSDRFEYLQDLVHMVAKGVQPSVMLTGTAGVGKSYLVQKTLAEASLEEDTDYIVCKGHSSPMGLYQLLHDHRDQLIVFDDCDSAMDDNISANLLKAALDSYDKRIVSWHSNKTDQLDLEKSFEFTGSVIFISNMQMHKVDPAIRSRAFCYNLHLSPNEVHEYMGCILPNIMPNVSMEEKKEVWNYLGNFKEQWDSYNLRTLLQSIRIKLGTREGKDWKKMIQILADV